MDSSNEMLENHLGKTELEGIGNPFPIPPPYIRKPETDSRPLGFKSLIEFFTSTPKDVEWRVDSFFPKGGVGIIAGLPGQGKSWMALDLAIECSMGGLWLTRFQTRKCKVLYIDEESTPTHLRERLSKLIQFKGYAIEDVDLILSVGKGLNFSVPSSVVELKELLAQQQPGLVVIDSFIRVHSSDENSASEMSKVNGVLKCLKDEFGCTFILIDHQKKPGQSETASANQLRGSSEKSAFLDSLLSVRMEGEKIHVHHSKSRSCVAHPDFSVLLQDHGGATSVTYVGEDTSSPVFGRADLAGFTIAYIMKTLGSGESISRQQLIQGADLDRMSIKSIDENLKSLVASDVIERQEIKLGEGRGGPAAFYRLTAPVRSEEKS